MWKQVPVELYLFIAFLVAVVGYLIVQDETTKFLAISTLSGLLGYVSKRAPGQDDEPAGRASAPSRVVPLILIALLIGAVLIGAVLIGTARAQEPGPALASGDIGRVGAYPLNVDSVAAPRYVTATWPGGMTGYWGGMDAAPGASGVASVAVWHPIAPRLHTHQTLEEVQAYLDEADPPLYRVYEVGREVKFERREAQKTETVPNFTKVE